MKNWKLWAKKILVFTLLIAMTVNTVDISVLAAAIGEDRSDEVQSEKQIAESEPLEGDIQTPDTLTVTTEQKTTEQKTTEQETTDVLDVQNVKNSNDGNEGTYTTLSEEENEDETSQLPELTGKMELSIPNGSSLKEGVTITATFTDENYSGNTEEPYTYTWYCVDGDTETDVQTSPATLSKESKYMIKQEDIGKSFYCKVTKAGSTGEVKSETIGPVLGISIEGATITLANTNLKYDGTAKKPTITVTLSDGVSTITQNVAYTASYENNVHAGTAKVIITGIGRYYGTAETTFTIGQKTEYEDGLEIEGVADSYEYTGEEIRPQIVVKDGGQVIPESQYTVSYENNKNPGTATVRITGKDDGDYYFGEDYNHKSFTITHDHDWAYTVNNWTIRMECKKNPCPQKRATLKLEVNDEDPLKYNGTTRDVVAVLEYPSGIYPENKIKKVYTGDGLENGLPKNAGSYTAAMSIEEGGVTYTATLKFEIQKADTQIGTVTAGELENTLDVDQVQLSRTDTTIPGTLKLKDGTVLQYGTHDYPWVFEPEDRVNYDAIDGIVSITVKDTIAPSASWKIGESGFRKFVNTISFGYLCKNTETMEIVFEDAESGVATKQYYIADQEITDFSGVEWTDYTAPVVLPLGQVRIVYVRVTDNVGNTSILNSDGLTVYQESALETDKLSYTYKEGQPRELYVKLNGNIFSEVVDDRGQALGRNLNYEFDDPSGRLTLSSSYLDGLSVGTHTYQIKLHPQGRQEVETIAYNFSIIVEKAKLYVVDASAKGRTYDGSNLVNVTGITLGRVDGYRYEPGPSVDINNMQGTLEKADAGTYQSVTLPTLTLTGSDVDSYELVQPDGPVDLLPSVTISKKAAPAIQTMEKSYVYVKDVVETIDLTQFLPSDCGEAVFGKPNHGAGEYEYYKVAPSVNGNILSYTAGKTTWEQLQLDKRGELVVPVQMTNYEDTEIRFTLRLRDQTNVVLKQGMEVRLKNNVLTYGEPLSKLIFEDAVFTDEAGNVIEGKIGWMDGTWVPYAGITVGTWQFKPADAEYKSVDGSVDIVVNPAKPTIETPAVVAERAYDPTKALEDSDLTGGVVRGVDGTVLDGTWSWKQSGIVPTMNNSGYEAVFTPNDTNNYTTVDTTIAVKVKKAVPVIVQKPVASEISWGESLAASVLTGGSAQHGVTKDAVSGTFAWKDATIRPNVADSDQTAFTLVFTPDDTEKYEVTETTVTLNIKRAGKAPNFPADRMDAAYVCKQVKDAALPDGWKWADADLETELAVGTPVLATAVYTGEGHGNYEIESTVIEITRLACTHQKTELKNTIDAGCGKKGYTGDTVCKDCGILLNTGSEVAALTHDYRESSRKEPTSYAEGEIIYTCKHCGDSYSVKIDRLPDSGNNNPVPVNPIKSDGPQYGTKVPGSNNVRKNTKQPADNAKKTKRDDMEPFIRGKDGKEGWNVIKEDTAASAEGSTVTVDMNGSSVVPGDIFDAIRGKDITIEFDLGNGITWQVNGKSVTKENIGDIDFSVSVGKDASDTIPVDVINALTGERFSMNLTLAYDGAFGFEATLCLNVGEANKGLIANLFYYNADTNALEFICADEVDENGQTELVFTHASDYTIILDTASMEPVAGAEDTITTDTADNDTVQVASAEVDDTVQTADAETTNSHTMLIWLIVIVCIAVVAAGIVIVVKRKEK